ncbi:MAG TPA: lamin tail domain-containing protein [Bacteroidales bacterium]|nr:lamin tail domain-containing protein [Bacteroidales bacterium]
MFLTAECGKNTGQTLILKNRDGKIISSVTYSDHWYKNEYKADGGWSLEQIDPFNPCGEENNWEASKNEIGGTPGQINSIDAENPDTESPELLRAAVTDENTIQLFFNESLHPETAIINENYRIDHDLGNPDTVDIITPENKSVLLSFEYPFEPNTIYEVEITGDITDCAGNIISGKTTAKFAVPQTPEPSDLVINEILFNPFAEGVDFVEIYNRSNKIFDLNQLRIASYDDEKNDYKSVVKASDEGHLIFPGEYLVITESPEIVMNQYYTQNPNGFAKVSSLPAYNNDKGRVIIMDKSENTIDNFAYTEDMHFALLASNKGVSLERINYDRPTEDKTNWHSASEVVGFATPTYENSQFNPLINLQEKITIDPDIFSPDNDGYQDVTNISFNTEEPGYVVNIKIFDSHGRLIKYLANNTLLGINQTITWDGLDDKNQKAAMGVYVVFIELFDLEGNVKQYKKSVVVAAKLQ